MKKLVRNIARILLGIVTAMTSFTIAACYGVWYAYERTGRVVDALTRAGIDGIQVECLRGGSVQAGELSSDDGQFWIGSDVDCEQLRFRDIDGTANGTYQEKTIPAPTVDDQIVELTPGP